MTTPGVDASTAPLDMHVHEVFRFADGRTVIVGEVARGPARIGPCRCELLVSDQVAQQLTLEGEMIPLRRGPSNGLRSVSTRDPFTVALDLVREGACRLVGTAPCS